MEGKWFPLKSKHFTVTLNVPWCRKSDSPEPGQAGIERMVAEEWSTKWPRNQTALVWTDRCRSESCRRTTEQRCCCGGIGNPTNLNRALWQQQKKMSALKKKLNFQMVNNRRWRNSFTNKNSAEQIRLIDSVLLTYEVTWRADEQRAAGDHWQTRLVCHLDCSLEEVGQWTSKTIQQNWPQP